MSDQQGTSSSSRIDLRNLCHRRLDVESLRSKLPVLPQWKLPKLRARKIFRRSHDNVTAAAEPASSKSPLAQPQAREQQRAGFINHMPTRISTISSLLSEQAEDGQASRPGARNTYYSAGSVDDVYYGEAEERIYRPISPVRLSGAVQAEQGSAVPLSLGQRLQRGCKDMSMLRLKHLFAKKTIVRRDGIEVQHYAAQYEVERQREQLAEQQRDFEIADNYNIKFQLARTRQNSVESQSSLDVEEQQASEHSRMRHPVEQEAETAAPTTRSSCKQRIQQLRETSTELLGKLPGLGKLPALSTAKPQPPDVPTKRPAEQQRGASLSPQQTAAQTTEAPQPMGHIMKNIKRLHKSIRSVHRTKTLPKQPEEQARCTLDGGELQQAEQAGRPDIQPSMLMQKLQSLRTRKSSSQHEINQTTDAVVVAASSGSMAAQLEQRFASARQRTIKKVNEKLQQIRGLPQTNSNSARPATAATVAVEDEQPHQSSDSDSDEVDASEDSEQECGADAAQRADQNRTAAARGHELAALSQLQQQRGAGNGGGTLTAWTTEPILCDDSIDSDDDTAASDYPRVCIHQDNSDVFESTLIIAVKQYKAVSASPTSGGSEQALHSLMRRSSTATDWLPNEQIIAQCRAQPTAVDDTAWQTRQSTAALYKPKSIDIFETGLRQGGLGEAFADFDEALRNAPVLRVSADSSSSSSSGSGSMDDSKKEQQTQVKRQIGNSRESLIAQLDGELDESDDETETDDHYDANSNVQQQRNVSRPPSATPSPPPKCAQPSMSPPPLPERRQAPPPQTPAPIYDAVPPPLPSSKPPLPPMARVLEHSASMSRPAKPLVKTSSLRLHYNEQMQLSDIGKVNKLICRFETPQQRRRAVYTARDEHCTAEDSDAEQDNTELRDITPTPANINRKPRAPVPKIVTTQPSINNAYESYNPNKQVELSTTLSLDRQNSNCSRSEYGSPLSYPSSRRASHGDSTTTVDRHAQQEPLELQRQARHVRRSLARDDDNYYSFDSDEENSYYSISPSGSSRYVVEI